MVQFLAHLEVFEISYLFGSICAHIFDASYLRIEKWETENFTFYHLPKVLPEEILPRAVTGLRIRAKLLKLTF